MRSWRSVASFHRPRTTRADRKKHALDPCRPDTHRRSVASANKRSRYLPGLLAAAVAAQRRTAAKTYPIWSQKKATTQQATSVRGCGRTARRSRVVWPDVRRAVREAHELRLVHAVKVRRDGAIDLVIKRDDASAKSNNSQHAGAPGTAAPQQAAKTRKQKRMARKDAFHQRKRDEAAAALGRPPGLQPPALLLPPPPAPPIPPLATGSGASSVTMGERVDKREAAQVGADKTPTKQNEETNEAGDESRVDERSSSERKKTRGSLHFSNATGRSYSR